MNFTKIAGIIFILLCNSIVLSQPSDQNFDSEGLNLVNGTSNTIGDWTFTANASAQLVSPTSAEQSSNLNLDGGGLDRAFQWSYFGAAGVNTFGLESADGSEFDLNSFDFGNGNAFSPTSVTVTGYRDGSSVTSSEVVDLTSSDATGDISYGFVATTAGGSYGSMSFGSAYDNVDELEFAFSGNAGAEIDNIDVSAPTLPVELLFFGGELLGGKVVLNWSTSQEIQNKGFLIERREASSDWQAIEFVPGSGTSDQGRKYEYIDPAPNVRATNYYRLAQTDWDGQVHYSQQIEVFVPNGRTISAYPNPTEGNILIDLEYNRQMARVSLMDIQGKVLESTVYKEVQLINYFIDKPGGYYLVEVSIAGLPPSIIKIVKR